MLNVNIYHIGNKSFGGKKNEKEKKYKTIKCDCGKDINIPDNLSVDYDDEELCVLYGNEVPNGAMADPWYGGYCCKECHKKAGEECKAACKDSVDYVEKCRDSPSGMVCSECDCIIEEPYFLVRDGSEFTGDFSRYYCSKKCAGDLPSMYEG